MVDTLSVKMRQVAKDVENQQKGCIWFNADVK